MLQPYIYRRYEARRVCYRSPRCMSAPLTPNPLYCNNLDQTPSRAVRAQTLSAAT